MFVFLPQAIEPQAQAVADAMGKAYRDLRTLRCTVVDRSRYGGTRAQFVFRRPGTVLVQKMFKDRPGVDTEYRLWGDKLVIDAQENSKRYLRTTVGHREALRTPMVELAEEARVSIDELVARLEARRPPFDPKHVTEMRLGERTVAADGTSVDVLNVTTVSDAWSGGRTFQWTTKSVYQIGVADHLIRRTESEGGGNGESSKTNVEYEDVVANASLPADTFVYRPAKGMVAVDWNRAHENPDPKTEALLEASGKALKALVSLSFTDEWVKDDFVWDDQKKPHPNVSRATIRFDLQRPVLGRGELSVLGSDHESLSVVSDGRSVFSREGKSAEFLKVPVGEGYPLSIYGGRGVPLGAGDAARLLVRAFYPGTRVPEPYYRNSYRLVGVETVDGTPCDVLEIGGEPGDAHGIPSGLRWTNRFYLGRQDHLPRRYEESSAFERAGKVYTQKTVERFTRMVPNATIAPSLFVFDETKGNGVSDLDRTAHAVPNRALAGDTPSGLPTRTLDGKAFSIADFKGKVVIVDAYTYGCYPCRQHMLGHRALVKKYAARGLTTVGLILDREEEKSTLERFVAQQKLSDPQLFDGQGWEGPAAKRFGIASVPFTVIVGRDGKVAYVDPPDAELERILASELNK